MRKILLLACLFLTLSCNNMGSKKTKVIFLGDSITQQGADLDIGFISLLKNNLSQSDFELIGKGISGNKISDLLVRYKTDVLDLNPDIVFIYIGINDVWHKYDFGTGSDIDIYEKGLRKIISDISSSGSKIVLCTPTVIGENTGDFELGNKFKDVQFYKVNLNKVGTSPIDCEVDEWKDCNNLSYITHKEMAKSLDKTTKR